MRVKTALKVSVRADGTVLVEGRQATLEQLDAALAEAKASNGQVWYHREAVRGGAPPTAKEVIQRIVALKLPVSLSSKPDFSDWVDAKGVSHPRNAPKPVAVYMPEVEARSGLEDYFANVRKSAAGRGPGDGLVIVRPNRTMTVLPRLAESDELKKMAEGMNHIVPATTQRNIAAIAFTVFDAAAGGAAALTEVSKAIPFMGMLVGLSYIGHAVWVFEGHPSALVEGCRNADLLLVDSAMRPLLANGWDAEAAAVMRHANILVHSRANFGLLAIRKIGTDPSRIEFSS
jgi:hypothetical protein